MLKRRLALVIVVFIALAMLAWSFAGLEVSLSPGLAGFGSLPTLTPSREVPTVGVATSAAPTVIPFDTFPTTASLLPLPTVAPITDAPSETVPGHVVVMLNPNIDTDQRAAYIAAVEAAGATVTQDIGALNTLVVSLPADGFALPVSVAVVAAEPDYYVTALGEPSDPLYAQQWALPVMNIPAAWDALSLEAPPVTVAILDSGICADHPDLTGRTAGVWDYIENDPVPQDEFGHGCSVAGIISATADNGVGMAGIAPNVHILIFRVLDAYGRGTYSDVAAAIVDAVNAGAQIVNLSLGGANPSGVLEQAVRYADERGVLVVAAAGNTGREGVLYPAAYESVVAVAAVDPNLQRSSFSTFGPEVDLLAPGRNILTTRLDGGYALMNGSSFGAANTVGVAALEMGLGRQLIVNGGVVAVGGMPTSPTPVETITVTATPNADMPTETPTPLTDMPTDTLTDTPTIQILPTETATLPGLAATPSSTAVACLQDMNGDGIIDMADLQSMLGVYRSARGDDRYQASYDLNVDGMINILDLQNIAERSGHTCAEGS